jgi:hypothetical protein
MRLSFFLSLYFYAYFFVGVEGCCYSLSLSHTHTHTHTHTLGRTPLDGGSASRRDLYLTIRSVFTHGPQGPGPRAANFQRRHIKKIEIEVWYAEKKRLSTREKFKGDLYWKQCWYHSVTEFSRYDAAVFLLTHNWIRTNKGGGGAKFSWAQGRKKPKYGPADKTPRTKETGIHAPGEIRTNNRNNLAYTGTGLDVLVSGVNIEM